LEKRYAVIRKVAFLVFLLLISIALVYPNYEKGYLVLGQEEGEGMLILPTRIKEGPDGNIYVLDQGDAFIKIYSPEGKYLRRIAGNGQGPGEIQRADGANFGFTPEDKLFFTESFGGHRWITILELTGKVNRLVHLDFKEHFGISEAFAMKDGGFLLDVWFGSRPEIHKDYFLYRYPEALIRVDSEGKVLSEIVRTEYLKTISSVGTGGDQWIPFFPAFSWIAIKSNLLLFADGLSRELKIYDFKGNIVNELKTDLPQPARVRDDDLEEWRRMRERAFRDKSLFNRVGRVIYKYKESVYKSKPNLANISSTPDGNILVTGPYREGNEREFWLLNENGKTVIKIAFQSNAVGISKHFIFLMVIDKEENRLAICQKRVGKEDEDLLIMRGIRLAD
jgi:hypothetical protein